MRIVSLDHNFNNGSPARVHRPTGTVYLTPLFYKKYTPQQQRFIILHELGHYVNQTTDESEADRFAADIMLNLDGYKATFRALNESLHDGAESDQRRINLFGYLKTRDMEGLDQNAIINGNREYGTVDFCSFEDENGCVFTNDYIGVGELDDIEIADYLNFCDFYGLEYSDMSAKDFRAAKRQAKIDKAAAKNDLLKSKADAKRTKAEAKMQKANAKLELAKQGISGGAKIGEAFGKIGESVAGIFGKKLGGGGDDPAEYAGGAVPSDGGGKSKLPLIIGGVVVVVIVTVIIIVVVKKKKGK